MASFLYHYILNKREMKFIILLFGLLSIKDCNNGNKSNYLNIDKNAINTELNGSYIVSKILENDILPFNIEINFDSTEQRVTGFSGCNRFFGNYTLTGDSIQFSPLGSTKMICDEKKNNVEMILFETLSKVNKMSYLENNTISLMNEESTLLTLQKKPQKNTFVFEYSALSRGSYKNIIIDKNTVKVLNKRNIKPLIKPCNEIQWSLLLDMVKRVDLETISNLKAPSSKRLYDGAAIGNLSITYNGKNYTSSSFDHGNPPEELAEIVKEILSMSEKIE